jgi:AcrR family transcriptional regulator
MDSRAQTGGVASAARGGYGSLYRVAFERLVAAPGSRNPVYLERLNYYFASLDDFDESQVDMSDAEFMEWFEALKREDVDTDGEDDVLAAARDIVEGKKRLRRDPEAYVHALHLMCQAIGVGLDNAAVAPAPLQHFGDVDQTLARQDLLAVISMEQLLHGGDPINLPRTGDFPLVGHMPPEDVQAARGELARYEWAGVPADVRDTIALLDRWIEEAAKHGEGLVCFYL